MSKLVLEKLINFFQINFMHKSPPDKTHFYQSSKAFKTFFDSVFVSLIVLKRYCRVGLLNLLNS